jgi:hypothetical protein
MDRRADEAKGFAQALDEIALLGREGREKLRRL